MGNAARTVAAALCRSNSIPEPIRLADQRSRAAVKAWLQGKEFKGKELKEMPIDTYPEEITWYVDVPQKRKASSASPEWKVKQPKKAKKVESASPEPQAKQSKKARTRTRTG